MLLKYKTQYKRGEHQVKPHCGKHAEEPKNNLKCPL